MNNHKFAFIICSNRPLLMEECLYYINHLVIPEGYSIDVLTIQDAVSMASAYNEAMAASDAKYKIYMHQDVYLLNRNFLMDLLAIFQSDPQIGLIGMVGYDSISSDGIMWHAPRCGNLYYANPPIPYPALEGYSYSLEQDSYHSVALIDGLLMATAYDLPWDSVLLTGWDFYDAFQSIHFLQKGYRIAVPSQRHPWCLHDSGPFNNMVHYNQYLQIFRQHYNCLLGKNLQQIHEILSKTELSNS